MQAVDKCWSRCKKKKESSYYKNQSVLANRLELIGMLMLKGGCFAFGGHQVGMWAALGPGAEHRAPTLT